MLKRIAAGGVVTFVMLAACCALAQKTDQSLPDAPSAQASAATAGFPVFIKQVRAPSQFGAMSGGADAMRQAEFAAPEKLFRQKESRTIFDKYLDPSLPKRRSVERVSGDGLMERATHAAAGIFVTRDESGNGRLNTTYLVRALGSVAAETASRPYWRRSATDPVSAFGSTVGNDAGINLLHEFAPGIKQVVKNHGPRFAAKIVERIGHN
jgi:hypothetical protein